MWGGENESACTAKGGETHHMEVIQEMLSHRRTLHRAIGDIDAVELTSERDDQVGLEDGVEVVRDASLKRIDGI